MPGFEPWRGVAERNSSEGRSDYAPRVRVERLIATCRVVLAICLFLALWLDPSTRPAQHWGTTNVLLAAYVAYAVVLTMVAWVVRAPSVGFGLVTHAVDLALFSLFVYLTERPASPFYTYFIFAMVGATLRWQWRGALWTALVALVAFNAVGLYEAKITRDPGFELNRFVIRSAYLAVIASLLVFLGAHEQRRRREMHELAGWPRAMPQHPAAVVREVLERAAAILRAPRALVVWEDADEPWLQLASWSVRGEFHLEREPPGTFDPLVAAPLAEASFFSRDAGATAPSVLGVSSNGLEEWREAPLNPALQSRFAVHAVLCLCLRGECVTGRLLLLDRWELTADDLVLGEIVARQAAASLDHLLLSRRLSQAAATEERVRLSRDLHDGVLQSLTGAALKLETAQRMLETQPRAARQRLREIQRLIADEQRNLRFLIRDSKLPSRGAVEEASLDVRLHELVQRLEGVWDIRVEPRFELPDAAAGPLAYDICHVLQEAVVNAARHAGASRVRVDVREREGQLQIVVADNGSGFPFHGHYDHAALSALQLGPVILKERVDSLGGTQAIDSSPTGARLEIRLPSAATGA